MKRSFVSTLDTPKSLWFSPEKKQRHEGQHTFKFECSFFTCDYGVICNTSIGIFAVGINKEEAYNNTKTKILHELSINDDLLSHLPNKSNSFISINSLEIQKFKEESKQYNIYSQFK